MFRGEGAGQSVRVTSDPVCEALEPGVFSLRDGAMSLSYELKDECDFDSRARWQAFSTKGINTSSRKAGGVCAHVVCWEHREAQLG